MQTVSLSCCLVEQVLGDVGPVLAAEGLVESLVDGVFWFEVKQAVDQAGADGADEDGAHGEGGAGLDFRVAGWRVRSGVWGMNAKLC